MMISHKGDGQRGGGGIIAGPGGTSQRATLKGKSAKSAWRTQDSAKPCREPWVPCVISFCLPYPALPALRRRGLICAFLRCMLSRRAPMRAASLASLRCTRANEVSQEGSTWLVIE